MAQLLAELQDPRTQDVARRVGLEPDEIMVAQRSQETVNRALPNSQLGTDLGQGAPTFYRPQIHQNSQRLDEGLYRILVVSIQHVCPPVASFSTFSMGGGGVNTLQMGAWQHPRPLL